MDREDAGKVLGTAFPVEQSEFITGQELDRAIAASESKMVGKLSALKTELELTIKASELTQRNWILSGVVAILLATGGIYVSLVMKLDRLEQGLPLVQQALDKQTAWMERQELKDQVQDEGLREVNPKYVPYLRTRDENH